MCIATGPSLTAADVDRVRASRERGECRVIAINDAGGTWRTPNASWADVLYAADHVWWNRYRPDFAGLKLCGQQITVTDNLADAALDLVGWQDSMKAPKTVINPGFSGFQAFQLPILWGARRVLLLGYDCRANGSSTNYFGQKDPGVHKSSPYAEWAKDFLKIAPMLPADVEIVNCTVESAVRAFPIAPLSEVL